METREIQTRSALVRSRIPGVRFVINPYRGCGHGCRYCYAVFMTKYSSFGANARWGSFVEAKMNVADLLRKELAAKRKTGAAMLSSVCDPYQPAESRYELTRKCLLVLREFGWEIHILTRSPLVLRDIDILKSSLGVSVGMSVPTDDDAVRKITEPAAPPIEARIEALRELRAAGLDTWAFIAPILPMNPDRLHEMLAPAVNSVMMDNLNYRQQVRGLFCGAGWHRELTDEYAAEMRKRLTSLFAGMLSDEKTD